MNGRPIAFFQASCPSFPICTRFSMPGQPSSRQNLQIFHRRGAFQAFLCATPGARRSDAHAGAPLYIYVKAPTLRYGIWVTPRVIRNEKMQDMLTRASADSTPILTDQQPSSGSFGQTMAVRVSRRVGNTSKGNMCRPGSLPMRAHLGTRQKCRGNVQPWHTSKRHRSSRPLHFKTPYACQRSGFWGTPRS
jgi:hypothetical protein